MPSPPFDELALGPLILPLYGVMVMLGFLVWTLGTAWLWERGGGDPIDAAWACVLAAPGALVGARIYSVLTDLDAYRGDPADVIDARSGGLGIYGAVAGALMLLVVVATVRRWPLGTFLDVAIVFLPLAQAIGRFGNWFNQELYGGPTSLPWGLAVDPARRPPGLEDVARFHPTFLYEAIWSVLACMVLVALIAPRAATEDGRRRGPRIHARYRPGALVGVYLILYGTGRFLVEGLRIDPTIDVGGLRLNQVVSLLLVATGMVVLVLRDRRRDPSQRSGR